MPLQFELFATGSASADDLWAVVGDPSRLPEWTDADEVRGDGLSEGARIVTVTDGAELSWEVVTVGDRIWEARADVPAGTLGLGVRVVPDPRGSRLILAAALTPSGSRLQASLVAMPRLRARCDRWAGRALSAAKADV